MSRARPKPDLTLVTLIHQSLRADAARLAATIAELGPSDRRGRLPGVQAFFGQYREQLALHHSHEDVLFFPALAGRAGASTMHLSELAAQHEALDAALLAVGDRLAALADPASDFAAVRAEAASALSAMARVLDAHLRLEEQTAIPLFESDMPAADYKKLEASARKATSRTQTQFLVPWVVAHATPAQRKALFKSAPPLRVAHWLTRRRYRRLDQALARPA
jgi:iron-sulfur cluster repair protein YtfE (RIC family)